MSFPLFFGFKARLIAERTIHAPAPEPDGRLKDEVLKEESRQKKRAQQALELIDVPFFAELTELAVLNQRGERVFIGDLSIPGALHACVETLNQFFYDNRDDLDSEVLGYGFNVRNSLRILAVQVAAQGPQLQLDPIYWYRSCIATPYFVDPDETVVKTAFAKYLTPQVLWTHLNLRYPAEGETAIQKAEAALAFMKRLGLPR